MWRPQEIIVHRKVRQDPVTDFFTKRCPRTPVKYVDKGTAKEIEKASDILKRTRPKMLDRILAAKKIVFIAPASDTVDVFTMPDDRVVCPHFDRLKLASNGCFYQCDWCYLKLTYRAAFPYMTVRAQYDKIKDLIRKRIRRARHPVIFNSGELADSLAMEHLTGAGREFIPWFGRTENGYLYMLTKSDNVTGILDLPHNGHTVLAWSMNTESVSRKFEIGAPPFERRLMAAWKVQKAGYPLRIRLDPVVPFQGWQDAYAKTIHRIFERISPERVTLGTLRFEEAFYKMRNSIFTTGSELPGLMERMAPMFSPGIFQGHGRPKSGKYSFDTKERVEIFDFIIKEIRKHSDCRLALCKESAAVWESVNLPVSRCSCACQLDFADMSDVC